MTQWNQAIQAAAGVVSGSHPFTTRNTELHAKISALKKPETKKGKKV